MDTSSDEQMQSQMNDAGSGRRVEGWRVTVKRQVNIFQLGCSLLGDHVLHPACINPANIAQWMQQGSVFICMIFLQLQQKFALFLDRYTHPKNVLLPIMHVNMGPLVSARI